MRRIGLIGCSGIVQKTHAIGYRALEGMAEVAALADVSVANRSSAGDLFGVPPEHRYADYREMLSGAAVDTVVIATPHAPRLPRGAGGRGRRGGQGRDL